MRSAGAATSNPDHELPGFPLTSCTRVQQMEALGPAFEGAADG